MFVLLRSILRNTHYKPYIPYFCLLLSKTLHFSLETSDLTNPHSPVILPRDMTTAEKIREINKLLGTSCGEVFPDYLGIIDILHAIATRQTPKTDINVPPITTGDPV